LTRSLQEFPRIHGSQLPGVAGSQTDAKQDPEQQSALKKQAPQAPMHGLPGA
jgi:hypothetical protein